VGVGVGKGVSLGVSVGVAVGEIMSWHGCRGRVWAWVGATPMAVGAV